MLFICVLLCCLATAYGQSCEGKCYTVGTDPDAPCQCNKFCIQFGDCCPDYEQFCLSCANRCDTVGNDDRLPCQCNRPCVDFGDCCADYNEVCGGAPGAPTDAELRAVAEDVWAGDTNRLSDSQYTTNPSGSTYFTYVDESVFSGPTFSAFVNLLDNYNPYTGTAEANTAEHQQEQNDFLNAVMATQPMQIVYNFLSSKGLAASTQSGFIEELKQYWFLLFTRSGGPLDSSGFEHVFVGEIKNGVSGFHGWVNFYRQEQNGNLQYTDDLGNCLPRVQRMSMTWLNNNKPISSMYVGTSPEYDLAMYTLCFVARAGSFCPVSTAGNDGNIVTYTMSGVSPKTVGTTYAEC